MKLLRMDFYLVLESLLWAICGNCSHTSPDSCKTRDASLLSSITGENVPKTHERLATALHIEAFLVAKNIADLSVTFDSLMRL